MQEPLQEMGVVCWRSTVPSRKHEEAQTRTIGGARRLFIHQTHVVDGSRRHAAPDLQDHEGEAEEGHQHRYASDGQRDQMGGGELRHSTTKQ